ncbi:aminotransferase class IV [Streptomyces sp. YIM 132580]|uniref:aminotransferase class IV n=1 Tax=Streptomyces sp. YIM 132580 TaxID=2691958 RepID=UPI00136A0D75|nr:aminotransferase class IV [Streptomyces sp. YIM 132580]MXG26036.1 class IV aminotransferase [Streptomyces sp. YIM 132580]
MTSAAPLRLPHVEMDGRPVTEDDLRVPALHGFGHFTALQVRDRTVRGLGPHLERLDAANRELFQRPLDGGLVRELIRSALDRVGLRDASVRVQGFLPPGEGRTRVMVTVREAATMAPGARSLMSVPYARAVPHIKRPGEFGQTYYGMLAARAGFDEALLTAPGGVVTEGAITNIGFWDGSSVVWPDAPALPGITMALLERGLAAAGEPSVRRPVTLDGLGAFRGAFLCNSQGIAPVRRIDAVQFGSGDRATEGATETEKTDEMAGVMRRLETVYRSAPADPL